MPKGYVCEYMLWRSARITLNHDRSLKMTCHVRSCGAAGR